MNMVEPIGQKDMSGDAKSSMLTIINKRGLHARASAKFVAIAGKFDANITVEKDGMSVGGTSIMGLMMLAASQQTQILVSASGPEANEALIAIEELVAARFTEDE